jgi:RNA polymerase sigma-70 factor, ECF subfamily
MQEWSDEELLAKSREQQHKETERVWIDELFARYHSRVAIWCYRFTGDREKAGDLAQDVFLRAYRNLASFRGGSKFGTWLYSIARNHCINEMKARAGRGEVSQPLDDELRDEQRPSILSLLEQQESIETVRKLMRETLDETERTVMVLHFAEGMQLDTVARLLGLTNPSGARAYLVSAKRKLAAKLLRSKAAQGVNGGRDDK